MPDIVPPTPRLSHCIDMLGHQLDPRCLLTEDQLAGLRVMFPNSCGVRLWLSHRVEILHLTASQLVEDQHEGDYIKYIAGAQPVSMSVLDCRPTNTTGPRMISSSVHGRDNASKAYLGLRLRLPDIVPVITTVTHNYVNVPGAKLWYRPFEIYQVSRTLFDGFGPLVCAPLRCHT